MCVKPDLLDTHRKPVENFTLCFYESNPFKISSALKLDYSIAIRCTLWYIGPRSGIYGERNNSTHFRRKYHLLYQSLVYQTDCCTFSFIFKTPPCQVHPLLSNIHTIVTWDGSSNNRNCQRA